MTDDPITTEEYFRGTLKVIAHWSEVDLSGEWETGLRGVIRSITDMAREVLSAHPEKPAGCDPCNWPDCGCQYNPGAAKAEPTTVAADLDSGDARPNRRLDSSDRGHTFDVAQPQQEPIGYAAFHPKMGWRPDLAAKSEQIATAVAMRSIESAAQQGWTIKPFYAAQPPAAPDFVRETCIDCGTDTPCDEDCPNYIEPPAAPAMTIMEMASYHNGQEPAAPVETDRQKLLEALPLQFQDGPDYCTVKDAKGKDFALTVQPDILKEMESALRVALVASSPVQRSSAGNDAEIEALERTVEAMHSTIEQLRAENVGLRNALPQPSPASAPLMDAGSIFTFLRERMEDETSASLAVACRALADNFRVLRAVPQTLGQWQPIDTAPREPDAMFMVCAVGDARGPFVVRSDILWRAREAGTPSHLGLDYLTHWMPLPEMPQ